jgi:hypothetical protein
MAVDKLAEIKRLYYETKPATINRDLARAVALLKEMVTAEERERAAVYMDGLSQMRSEWAPRRKPGPPAGTGKSRKGPAGR